MQSLPDAQRRTSADEVFDFLHRQIASLKLMPGTRISEVEVAKRFDMSRQPVREAFIRLANQDLIQIRPQKATVVRGFSYEAIQRSRFLRLAVECEIIRRACAEASDADIARLRRSLDQQADAVAKNDIERFHALDYEFHKSLCLAAKCGFAFKSIMENKTMVDRLCLLSLTQATEMDKLLADHTQIVDHLTQRNENGLVTAIKTHLARLDDVIASIRKSHANYFED